MTTQHPTIHLSGQFSLFEDCPDQIERLALAFVNGNLHRVAVAIADATDPAEVMIDVANRLGRIDDALRLARCIINEMHDRLTKVEVGL